MKKQLAFLFIILAGCMVGAGIALATSGTISSTYKYAWSNNTGWINFAPTNSSGGYVGLTVTDSTVTGYAWSPNTGWINFAPTHGGVSNTTAGSLSGSAWGEGVGWINLSGTSIGCNGRFSGTATGDIIGTINFGCTNCDVRTTWTPSGCTSSGGGGGGSGGEGIQAQFGSIVVTNNTIGGDGSFNFTTTGTRYADFTIVTAGGTGSNRQDGLLPGTYSVAEDVPSNWVKTQDTCSSIAVAAGGVATCSVTNVKVGSITVNKKTTGGDGTFSFTTSGIGYSNFDVSTTNGAGSNTQINLLPGTYSVAEDALPGWTQTENTCSSITLEGGQAAVCSISNAKNNPMPAIVSLSSTIASVGDSGFQLTIQGSGFINESVVKINGQSRPASVVSDGTAVVSILPSDLQQAGTLALTVVNPGPGGGSSSNLFLKVSASPLPPQINPPQSPNQPQTPGTNVPTGGGGVEGGSQTGGQAVPPQPVEPLPQTVLNSVQASTQAIADALRSTTEAVRVAVQSPIGNVATKVVATTGVAVSASAVAFLPSLPLSEIFLTPVRLWGLLLTALGIRKKKKPWGVVYDSATKQPLDPVYITLKDQSGKQVASAITDIDGRYGFLVEPGNYTIVASKTNYRFPSQQAPNYSDFVYENLYHGEPITVAQGQAIVKNIPLDPVKFDWNEFAKRNKNYMKFYSKMDLVIRKFSTPAFIIGFIVSFITLIFVPRPYNFIIFVLYLFMVAMRFVLRILGIRPKAVGYITKSATGNPLSFAIVRIFSPLTNTEISHKVTDQYGRYYCLVPRGKYYIKIDERQQDGSYQTVYISSLINADKNGIIREKFMV